MYETSSIFVYFHYHSICLIMFSCRSFIHLKLSYLNTHTIVSCNQSVARMSKKRFETNQNNSDIHLKFIPNTNLSLFSTTSSCQTPLQCLHPEPMRAGQRYWSSLSTFVPTIHHHPQDSKHLFKFSDFRQYQVFHAHRKIFATSLK